MLESRATSSTDERNNPTNANAFHPIQPALPLPVRENPAPPGGPQQNVNDALRNTVQGPLIPNCLPRTIEEFLHEHVVVYNLEKYRDIKKSNWDQRAKNAYSRRCYLYDNIKRRACKLRLGNMPEKMQAAARQMDVELRSNATLRNSVDKYIKFLKSTDTSVKKRKRNNGTVM